MPKLGRPWCLPNAIRFTVVVRRKNTSRRVRQNAHIPYRTPPYQRRGVREISMKIIKNEIRPIGFVTLELNENEVQTLIGVFEEIAYLHRRPFEDILGTRGDLYNALKETLTNK